MHLVGVYLTDAFVLEELPGDIEETAKADVIAVLVEVVLLRSLEIADELDLGEGAALGSSVVEVGGAGFLGDVDEVGEAEVLDLPGAAPVAGVVPFAVKAFLGAPQVEVFGEETGVDVDGGVLVEAGHIEGAVVHDVVEVDADAEAVGDGDQLVEFGLGSVAGANRATLLEAPEVEGIPQVVADGEAAAALGGWG